MALVVDVSAIAPLAFSDEDQGYANSVLDELTSNPGIVPSLFWYEIWNTLSINVTKRKRIKQDEAACFISLLEDIRLEVLPLASHDDLLALTFAHRITAYDAAYLELAKRRAAPLATQDAGLKKACIEAGVVVFSGG